LRHPRVTFTPPDYVEGKHLQLLTLAKTHPGALFLWVA
jgi:hypothetical protein